MEIYLVQLGKPGSAPQMLLCSGDAAGSQSALLALKADRAINKPQSQASRGPR
jgi:hypothetical protein